MSNNCRCVHPTVKNNIVQHGSYMYAKSWSTACRSLILDIHVMVNWHLSKQGICWPVPCLKLIKITCDWIAGSSKVNLGTIQILWRWPGRKKSDWPLKIFVPNQWDTKFLQIQTSGFWKLICPASIQKRNTT